jgi:nucleoside-diphosphate-sugar epimerase
VRVAVTGASGFIGRHVTAELRATGHEVVPLRRHPGGEGWAVLGPVPPLDPASVEPASVEPASIDPASPEPASPDPASPDPASPDPASPDPASLDPASLEELLAGADAVVHLAARRAEPGPQSFVLYAEPNVLLTSRVLDAAVSVDVHRFVLASSRAVYPSWLQGRLKEDCPHPPDTYYGLSKWVAEQVLRLRCAEQVVSGVSLRIGQVVGDGDGDRGILPRLIAAARNGGPLRVFGEGRAVRDFVDVRDVARAVGAALTADLTVPAVNVGGPDAHTIAGFAQAVADVAGLDPDAIVHEPTDDEDTSEYRLDSTLAGTVLGWEPRIDLATSIRDRLRT